MVTTLQDVLPLVARQKQKDIRKPSTATRRNECMQLDYLLLDESYGTTKYVLVLKDELTHYCELIAVESATKTTAAGSMLDWHKRFGLLEMWAFNNGTQFKATGIALLVDRLKALQKFVPVYTLWINGTV
ncbi:hypothetical protein CCR75_003352 [Bremia lactucae]|uniref:Integrase catalytic domain-containing protein n=1 Tax=Bremia lactucae TaxID=4779 RepID=A0A976FHK4_BRELC|nr:hypothetical protein CCR75_003352 [Bremia lactucae]